MSLLLSILFNLLGPGEILDEAHTVQHTYLTSRRYLTKSARNLKDRGPKDRDQKPKSNASLPSIQWFPRADPSKAFPRDVFPRPAQKRLKAEDQRRINLINLFASHICAK